MSGFGDLNLTRVCSLYRGVIGTRKRAIIVVISSGSGTEVVDVVACVISVSVYLIQYLYYGSYYSIRPVQAAEKGFLGCWTFLPITKSFGTNRTDGWRFGSYIFT